jgi:hypothetical protein
MLSAKGVTRDRNRPLHLFMSESALQRWLNPRLHLLAAHSNLESEEVGVVGGR